MKTAQKPRHALCGITLSLFLLAPSPSGAQDIATFAGTGAFGYNGDNIDAIMAQLAITGVYSGMTLDSAGNLVFSDTFNNRVRKVDAGTGIITTIAGTGAAGFSGDGGPATSARLSGPQGVAYDSAGNLYIADTFNYRVRMIDSSGTITTVAGTGVNSSHAGDGGSALSADLFFPCDVDVDSNDNLYIDVQSKIRVVDAGTGVISTVAGTGTEGFSGDGGPATAAELNDFFLEGGIALDDADNLYIADTENGRIRVVDTAGVITTIAGNGSDSVSGDGGAATAAGIFYPVGVDVDASGNVYIASTDSYLIRKVDADGIITTVVGSGAQGTDPTDPADLGDGGP
ncbi:MAG: hypothetical protein HKN82_12455, partial [Akkermansiaceae bacterium]|nr:hypothetical protein [Akkermansiaceae bacterium]